MILAQVYSHRQGLELIQSQEPELWQQIQGVIQGLEVAQFKRKVFKNQGLIGRLIYNHHDLGQALVRAFEAQGWSEARLEYWGARRPELVRESLDLPPAQQASALERAGQTPVAGSVAASLARSRMALEAPFAKTPLAAFDLWVKFPALAGAGLIDLGVELLPTRDWQAQMIPGLACYEEMLYHLLRQGDQAPPMPVLLLGLEP